MWVTGKCAHRPTSAASGFTLIEMLVILAILSLLAGIIFPSIEKLLYRQSFIESQRRVELGLRTARAMAVRTGVPVRVIVAHDGHGFSYGRTIERLPDTTIVRGPDQAITFFADGSAIGGDMDIVDRGRTERLTINAAIGVIGRRR